MYGPAGAYYGPPSAPVTPTRLYMPPGGGQSNHASTSYHHYQPQVSVPVSPIPPPIIDASPRTPRSHYAARYSRMDPSFPSHGASPQSAYSPSTPQVKTSYSQPESAGSNAPYRTYPSPAGPAPAPPTSTYEPVVAPPPRGPAPSGFSSDQIGVHETSVMQGSPGGEFTVKCELSFPPSPPSSPRNAPDDSGRRDRAVRIVFGNHPLPTTVTQIQDPLSTGQMVHLKVQVPGWTLVATAASGNRVPVTIQVLLGGQEIVGSVQLGDYSYLSFSSGSRVPSYGVYSAAAPTHNPLKRSGDALESHRPSPTHFLHRRMMSTGLKYESASPETSGHVPLPPTHSPGMQSEGYSSPHGSWGGPGTAPPSVAYGVPEQPNLQRASQVPISAPVSPFPTSSSGSKASLELVGDLNNMAKGWSTDEWNNRRRLVQFWRKQEGTTITAAFQGIPQDKYSAHTQSIIISCIFREDNNLCYVTSVDAIYLLEALVGNRFTVEEKNRIRRNLEGFRPLTVSKSKPGSEDFFKLIMGFPNPKPRNIEKDVKVFPWDILGQALKKIIGKYSASYPGAVSPALSAQMLPYMPTYTQPSPLQPADGMVPSHIPPYDSHSADSVPALSTNTSADSATFSATSGMYESPHDSTPHMAHMAPSQPHSLHSQPHHSHRMHPHSQPHSHGNSPSHYRSNSAKGLAHQEHSHHADYVNVSPTHMASYTGTTAYYPGMSEVPSPGGGPGGHAYHASGTPVYVHHQPQGHPDTSHQLPHVHQTIGREPSSNDLRVMYPALAQ